MYGRSHYAIVRGTHQAELLVLVLLNKKMTRGDDYVLGRGLVDSVKYATHWSIHIPFPANNIETHDVHA